MKILKSFTLASLFLACLILSSPFQGCEPKEPEPDNCDTCLMLYKPNIYIYPEERLDLFVHIEFPVGGEVITSIPEYGQGWDVTVDTNGLIDDTYTYLFYESTQPDVWQRDTGWIVQKDTLETFFKVNMIAFGFEGQEIQDFIDYWIPRLSEYDYYAIYPQNEKIIESAVQLHFSTPPDILRLFYVVKALEDANTSIPAPTTIKGFYREGYFATEWGVILD